MELSITSVVSNLKTLRENLKKAQTSKDLIEILKGLNEAIEDLDEIDCATEIIEELAVEEEAAYYEARYGR